MSATGFQRPTEPLEGASAVLEDVDEYIVRSAVDGLPHACHFFAAATYCPDALMDSRPLRAFSNRISSSSAPARGAE